MSLERKKDKSKVKELTERIEALEKKNERAWTIFMEVVHILKGKIEKLEEKK